MALCSLSTGKSTAPERLVASINSSPDMTKASLLASNTRLPAFTASSVGTSPAAPTIAAITVSTSAAVTKPSKSFMPVVTWILSVAGKTARNCFAAASSTICATFGLCAKQSASILSTLALATNPYTL